MKNQTILFVIAIFCFFSCSTVDDNTFVNNCVSGSGNIVSQTFEVDNFDAITITQAWDVSFSYADEVSFVAIGHENIMQFLEVSVIQGSLMPELVGSDCFRDLTLRFEVTAPDVNAFVIEGAANIAVENGAQLPSVNARIMGSGNIQFMEQLVAPEVDIVISGSGNVSGVFDCEQIDSQIAGSGNVTLTGEATQQEVEVLGSGNHMAFGLETDTTQVTIAGAGQVQVFVNDLLQVSIPGSGSVTYQGNPTVESTITGSGSVIDGN